MVAQSQQMVSVVAKMDPVVLQQRIDQGKYGWREAQAKREENKRTGHKPRELRIPLTPKEQAAQDFVAHFRDTTPIPTQYVDPELGNAGNSIMAQKLEKLGVKARTDAEIERAAQEGRGTNGKFLPRKEKDAAKALLAWKQEKGIK
ncbi:MAG: hypothetical protein KBD29_00845 [Candidatus Magasanikbacteria bacterium]|nr:hypothetical protein [Candidatus Magasanikbacteria bacterium]